ncbi:hypothetical protein PIB30_003484 [Stylosanthes scabra]|uniref:Uncharacterized protein n=1 Tax=Stylosanthes scabra TaxID=79078 RepID=A0ABU6V1L8_9FABA|nr:hypothetical protein [Stylosanthes scabra]
MDSSANDVAPNEDGCEETVRGSFDDDVNMGLPVTEELGGGDEQNSFKRGRSGDEQNGFVSRTTEQKERGGDDPQTLSSDEQNEDGAVDGGHGKAAATSWKNRTAQQQGLRAATMFLGGGGLVGDGGGR